MHFQCGWENRPDGLGPESCGSASEMRWSEGEKAAYTL